jgi:hypothetical protein
MMSGVVGSELQKSQEPESSADKSKVDGQQLGQDITEMVSMK